MKLVIQFLVKRSQSFQKNTPDTWHISAHFSLAAVKGGEGRMRLLINILGYLINRICHKVPHKYFMYPSISAYKLGKKLTTNYVREGQDCKIFGSNKTFNSLSRILGE